VPDVILRPPPNDGAAWRCSVIVPVPAPRFYDECGRPAVGVVVGKGPFCDEHDPEGD
jgi:hypothetical protein